MISLQLWQMFFFWKMQLWQMFKQNYSNNENHVPTFVLQVNLKYCIHGHQIVTESLVDVVVLWSWMCVDFWISWCVTRVSDAYLASSSFLSSWMISNPEISSKQSSFNHAAFRIRPHASPYWRHHWTVVEANFFSIAKKEGGGIFPPFEAEPFIQSKTKTTKISWTNQKLTMVA